MRIFQLIVVALMLLGTVGAEAQSLAELQQLAMENNPELAAKFKKVEAMMVRVDQANALQDPKLSFGYFISPVETRVGPQRARLSLSQMFPWFGTRSLQTEAAKLQADAAYQEFLDAQEQIALMVAQRFYPLYALEKEVGIQQAYLKLLEQLKVFTEEQFKTDQASLADIIRLDMQLEETRTALLLLDDSQKALWAQLIESLGTDSLETIDLTNAIAFEQDLLLKGDSLNQDEHPRLQAVNLRKQATEKAELVAKKAALPQIGLGVDYVFIGKRQDNGGMMNPPEQNGKDALMPMVTLSLPIFQKANKAKVKEQKLMQDYYGAMYGAERNKLHVAFEQQQSLTSQSEHKLRLYDKQLSNIARLERLYNTAYRNNELSIEKLIEVQQQRLNFEMKKLKAEAELGIALAELAYLNHSRSTEMKD